MPDQFSLFEGLYVRLARDPSFSELALAQQAERLRDEFRRDYMRGRNATDWTFFSDLPLRHWTRVINRLSLRTTH